jgi:hypothetical protein
LTAACEAVAARRVTDYRRWPRSSANENAWYRYSAGNGSKGRRWYSWALIDILAEPGGPDHAEQQGSGHHIVLVRRNDATGELAWYQCWSPRLVTLAELVSVAGRRWKVEENFQSAMGLVGLDQHQVRTWDSWHRWATLAMLAHAFLTVLAAVARDLENHGADLIALTTNETRRLLNAVIQTTARGLEHVLTWSTWRRRYQHRAR